MCFSVISLSNTFQVIGTQGFFSVQTSSVSFASGMNDNSTLNKDLQILLVLLFPIVTLLLYLSLSVPDTVLFRFACEDWIKSPEIEKVNHQT